MVQSMTGFGRIKKKIGSKVYSFEIHSVNRKGLDMNIYLPSELSSFEISIRTLLAESCSRGQINLKVFVENSAAEKIGVDSCRLAHETLLNISESLGMKEPISLELVIDLAFRSAGGQTLQGERVEEEVKEAVLELLANWKEMRGVEGKALAKDIVERLDLADRVLDRITESGKSSKERHKEKILSRIEELGKLMEEDHYRVARELILYAEKVDITEEIVRMRSHINQTKKLCAESLKSIGREMQFLSQEMTREMNTISSKISDLSGINDTIVVRGELEKIREQIQNIE
jgi:uncharacterized protein (TIGR00255 family)